MFLFDEPLSNLDAQLRAELRVEIKRLHQRLGATMIYVTHDQIEALTLADRIAVMKDRRFQQIGTPQEIYLRPVNRFVATFVGSPAMNFLPGRIALGADGPAFRSPALRVSLAAYPFVKAPVDAAPVELGIRPEHVVLAPMQADGQEVSVEMTEPMGSDLLAWTRAGDLPLSIRLPAETKLAPGDRLRILLPEHRLSLFDPANGAALLKARHDYGGCHADSKKTLSIQLYTLRSLNDLDAILDTVAAAGFRNVEGVGSHLDDAANVKTKLDARGLRFSSSHVSLAALRERPDQVIAALQVA